MQFVSGTHAISSVLFGILRPGDLMLSVTGTPYDTLEEVIGIRGKGKGSLLDLGVEYRQISIDEKTNSCEDKLVDFFNNNKCKLVFIQKSCGYSWRKSLNNNQIKQICSLVHSLNPKTCLLYTSDAADE